MFGIHVLHDIYTRIERDLHMPMCMYIADSLSHALDGSLSPLLSSNLQLLLSLILS